MGQIEVNALLMNRMKVFHDSIKNYNSNHLPLLLVRLMYCFYANDSGIFEKDRFKNYVIGEMTKNFNQENKTYSMKAITDVFEAINFPAENRSNEELKKFPYINGFFSEKIDTPIFDEATTKAFVDCFNHDWNLIATDIFGSMFQSIVDTEGEEEGIDKRRDDGIHYTSRSDIMKVLNPLLLDDLRKRVGEHKTDKPYLEALLVEIAEMGFLDPSCGCGNFLIVVYEELRKIEIEIYKLLYTEIHDANTLKLIFDKGIKVENFHGIELKELPATITKASMWITDHQMNRLISDIFKIKYDRLPLNSNFPNIVCANAVIDKKYKRWEDIVPKDKLTHIVGNPPYIGDYLQTPEQKRDMGVVFDKMVGGYKSLDYVTAWFAKAAKYIMGTPIKVAFVSTGSICQGEQAGTLWSYLHNSCNVAILFAHRSFKWAVKTNLSGNVANVFVVIIGFVDGKNKKYDSVDKIIYNYDDNKDEPEVIKAKNINGYLIDFDNMFIVHRQEPISKGIPPCLNGNTPNDGGNLLLTDAEKDDLLLKEPGATKYVKQILSADQFLNGIKRWCLWLNDLYEIKGDVNDLDYMEIAEPLNMPLIEERIAKVRELRNQSKAKSTRLKADTPHLFCGIRQEDGDYILIPRHSGERRRCIPLGFFRQPDASNYVVSDSCCFIPKATLYHFGILSSLMHMAWVKATAGRLGLSFRYSGTVVYNNFPWANPSDEDKKKIEAISQEILDIREKHKPKSLVELYEPDGMPQDLLDAHIRLDSIIDGIYRKEPFKSEKERLEFLFAMYKKAEGIVPDDETMALF